MSLTKDMLIKYIYDDLNIDEPLDSSSGLFSTGIMDSVGMVSLIAFVEERAGIRVQPGDVTLENFDTIDAIIAYVQSLD